MSKVQISHHYIIDAFRFSNFWGWFISEQFLWLLLYKSRETCLALQCIRMVVCRTEKYVLTLLLTVIIIIIIAIAHLLTVDKKRFHIKANQNQPRKRKIIYLYKSVNVNFLLCLKIYQNFKRYYAVKLNKTYWVNTFLILP